jgi:hypothetical protein
LDVFFQDFLPNLKHFSSKSLFWVHSTVVFKILNKFDIFGCVKTRENKGRYKINYKTDPAFYYIKEELARQINAYHVDQKPFTIDDLHRSVKNQWDYTGSRSKLHKIIKSTGYKWKTFNNRKI